MARYAALGDTLDPFLGVKLTHSIQGFCGVTKSSLKWEGTLAKTHATLESDPLPAKKTWLTQTDAQYYEIEDEITGGGARRKTIRASFKAGFPA